MDFEWEIYISDEDKDGPDLDPPPELPDSASPAPSEGPSNAFATSSSDRSHSINIKYLTYSHRNFAPGKVLDSTKLLNINSNDR
jgi:hypothetical protein